MSAFLWISHEATGHEEATAWLNGAEAEGAVETQLVFCGMGAKEIPGGMIQARQVIPSPIFAVFAKFRKESLRAREN